MEQVLSTRKRSWPDISLAVWSGMGVMLSNGKSLIYMPHSRNEAVGMRYDFIQWEEVMARYMSCLSTSAVKSKLSKIWFQPFYFKPSR